MTSARRCGGGYRPTSGLSATCRSDLIQTEEEQNHPGRNQLLDGVLEAGVTADEFAAFIETARSRALVQLVFQVPVSSKEPGQRGFHHPAADQPRHSLDGDHLDVQPKRWDRTDRDSRHNFDEDRSMSSMRRERFGPRVRRVRRPRRDCRAEQRDRGRGDVDVRHSGGASRRRPCDEPPCDARSRSWSPSRADLARLRQRVAGRANDRAADVPARRHLHAFTFARGGALLATGAPARLAACSSPSGATRPLPRPTASAPQ